MDTPFYRAMMNEDPFGVKGPEKPVPVPSVPKKTHRGSRSRGFGPQGAQGEQGAIQSQRAGATGGLESAGLPGASDTRDASHHMNLAAGATDPAEKRRHLFNAIKSLPSKKAASSNAAQANNAFDPDDDGD